MHPTTRGRHATVVVRITLHPTDDAVVPLIELIEVSSTSADDRVLRCSTVPDACRALEAWLRRQVQPADEPPSDGSGDDDRG